MLLPNLNAEGAGFDGALIVLAAIWSWRRSQLSPAPDVGRGWYEPVPDGAIIELYREPVRRIHRSFIPILRPDVARIIYPRS
jgi:hypothetical protein